MARANAARDASNDAWNEASNNASNDASDPKPRGPSRGARTRADRRAPDIIAIERGSQAGVEMAFGTPLCAVGSGLDADLVLMRDDLAAEHVILERNGRSGTVHALAEGVSVDGRPVPPNGCRRARLPARIEIADTALLWSRAPRPPRVPYRALALTGAASVALFAGLAASPVISGQLADAIAPMRETTRNVEILMFHSDDRLPSAGPATPDPMPPDLITTASIPSPAGSASNERAAPATSVLRDPAERRPASPLPDALSVDALSLFERHLRSLGAPALAGIALRDEAGTVVADGVIPPSSLAEWIDAQAWFDGRFAGAATLRNLVRAEEPKAASAPAIDAVWAGDTPYVVVDRERLAVGSVTRDGWKIVAIATGEVTLARDGRAVTMTF